MIAMALVGFGSGIASALLFASMVSGSPLSVVLFYLAPLPILIAAIGWRHPAGLIGAITGALGLAVALGPILAGAFVVGVGLPAWWLAYLALLARPNADGTAEWYPIGRLVLWTALIAAVLVTISVPLLADSFDDYRTGLRKLFEEVLRVQVRTPEGAPLRLPNGGDAAQFIDLLVTLVPPMAALLWTVTTLVNLTLAAKVVRRSGRLVRPWPDIAVSLTYPRGTALVTGLVAAGAALLPGFVGLASEVLATTLVTAFALLGLAVLHVITRGMAVRPLILGGTYVFIMLQTWPLIFFSLLGLADQLTGIRTRFLARRPPAPPIVPT
jgi:hypothetical protein